MRSLEHRFEEESKQRHKNLLWKIMVLVVFVMVMVWFRAYYGSMENYRKGERCLRENQVIRAVTYFDRSIHWYTPFNPYVQKSAERLWELGERAIGEGDTKLALIAFRTIRSGFYGASHFVVPGKDWIEKSESKISALLNDEEREKAKEQKRLGSSQMVTREEKSPHPDIFWSVVVEIGFLGWVGSLIGLIFYGWRPEDRVKTSAFSVLAWGCLSLGFFVLWIIGMMKA